MAYDLIIHRDSLKQNMKKTHVPACMRAIQ
jgi:hypothetical protein